jgi:tRNA(His) 5'-end guanylyltransferase
MNLSTRIKEFYEDRTKVLLPRKMITCIRLDGKGFSKLTKLLDKPFDDGFSDDMDTTAIYLCENIQGAKFAYTQSDEITIVMTDFDTYETSAWFDYSVQKMVSISASLATAKFNQLRIFRDIKYLEKLAMFDARVFQVPNVDEMVNTIIWRQQDASRNSISMASSAFYSHNALEGKSGSDKQDMLMLKGINWNDYKTKYKRGSVIKKISVDAISPIDGSLSTRNKWVADVETPIFTQDRDYLMDLVATTSK